MDLLFKEVSLKNLFFYIIFKILFLSDSNSDNVIYFLLFNLLIDTNGNSSFVSIGLPSWGSSGDSGGAAV